MLQVGGEKVNTNSVFETDMLFMFLIFFRVARAARFIRARTKVKISHGFNWFWLLDVFSPWWWWKRCVAKNKTCCSRKETPVLKSSWADVGLGTLAAVKAAKLRQEQKKKDSGLFKVHVRVGRYLGILRSGDEEYRRQLAASKIQRAWRGTVATRADDSRLGDESGFFRASSVVSSQRKQALLRRSASKRKVVQNPDQSKKRSESTVGRAMSKLTGQRVVVLIIVAFLATALFSYWEIDVLPIVTMITLHGQTANPKFVNKSLEAARSSTVANMYQYHLANGETLDFNTKYTSSTEDIAKLREIEKFSVSVTGPNGTTTGGTTTGMFVRKEKVDKNMIVNLISTIFILIVWYCGITAFAGPVMILVVIPIERMVKLLGMLVLDPLGYMSTSRYKRFALEEDEITKNTRWTKEVLKGMETSFLMNTIKRIGSLMKVGFGTAGVEIIRSNLQPGGEEGKNELNFYSEGSIVSCIFLFCDIRQFTDATESLQEEVFVFTNRVAAVVHSYVHAYGGSAFQNQGDAFLVSWLLDDVNSGSMRSIGQNIGQSDKTYCAKHNQADKALLSVVKINIALHHDNYYLHKLGGTARERLLNKLAGRKGPVVQLGCGLYAGKAVQGAIGSQRKIDPTYVSESVNRAEFLESSTKKYGVKMLMSDSFWRLLQPCCKRRCRKVDQLILSNEDNFAEEETYLSGDKMELYTFDMNIDALWSKDKNGPYSGAGPEAQLKGEIEKRALSRREFSRSSSSFKVRRRSKLGDILEDISGSLSQSNNSQSNNSQFDSDVGEDKIQRLVLPTGPVFYNQNVWKSEEISKIRSKFEDGCFSRKFNSGLKAFYRKDWIEAKECFTDLVEKYEDGPSKYFLAEIRKYNGRPPRHFIGYGKG